MKALTRAVAAAVVLAVLLLYVWERVDVVRLGYHIERLKTKKLALEREKGELQVKLSALTAPERIARLATERLGLTTPQQGQVVLVKLPVRSPAGSEPEPRPVRVARQEVLERSR